MAEALKDSFGPAIVRRLANELHAVDTRFPRAQFERQALDGFAELELMARGRHLADVLRATLDSDIPSALAHLLRTLPPQRDTTGGMASFFYLPHTEFVRRHGGDHVAASLDALYLLTQHFTGEFAIRPFLERATDETMRRLRRWSTDPNEHVRRLVSEGTRPRLPWAPRLRVFAHDPSPVFALLTTLRDDPSEYVRRSVANHLNDLSREHPEQLLDVAESWIADAPPLRRALLAHALRSLVKAGNARVLALLGYGARVEIDVEHAVCSPARPRIGERVTCTATLHNAGAHAVNVVADLIVHFVKQRGDTSPKVFKVLTATLAPDARTAMRKTIALQQLSTRTHYAGVHRVELQLNGQVVPFGKFTLLEE